MFDLKVIHSVLDQLQEERGIPKEKMLEAIEMALATAYKKEFGKKGQIVRAKFDSDSGATEFFQVKVVVDPKMVIMEDSEEAEQDLQNTDQDEIKIRYNPEHHMLIEDARRIKKDAQIDEELIFPLENKADFGRIAAQTAKQVIIQKMREAEKVSVLAEFGKKDGEVVSGIVQRFERGTLFVDMGRAMGVIPYEEQIPGERFNPGERIKAYLYTVEESPKGIVLRLSRSHPQFLTKLFEVEAPEIAQGVVEIKAIAREAGARSKIAVRSKDEHIDPIGSLVGQRGVRVNTVTSELHGEKIDIIEWNEDPARFIEESLSPAKIESIVLNKPDMRASVKVAEDQQSLAIGKGGQNVRLAAKLTGWKIDIQSSDSTATSSESPMTAAETETKESDVNKDDSEKKPKAKSAKTKVKKAE